jgi:hypothetical protein
VAPSLVSPVLVGRQAELVYGGEVEAGLALMRAVGEEGRRLGLLWITTRAVIALSDQELMLGRYADAVGTAEAGMPLVEQAGLERTVGALIRGNKAEALMRSGRWSEARAVAAPGAEAPGVYAGTVLLLRAELHVLSGHRQEAETDLRDARRHLRRASAAQFTLPLAGMEAELARSAGDLDAASGIIQRALGGRPMCREGLRPMLSPRSIQLASNAFASPAAVPCTS